MRKDGKIEELTVKGYSSLFISNTTGFYSTKLTKVDNVTHQIPKRMKLMFGSLTIIISILLYLAVFKSGLVDLGFNSIGNIVVTVINCMFFGLLLTSLVCEEK